MALRVVTFKVEDDFLREIDYYSEQLGMSRSEFIRYALEKMIEEIMSESTKNYVGEALVKTVIY